jgi:DNA primase
MTSELDIKPVLCYHGASNVPESSSWRTMKCPYHEDRNASARTNGFGFMCHGCGVKGNALSLLMEVDKLDFLGALTKYEEITGESVPRVSGKTTRQRRREVPFESRDYERGSDLFSLGIRRRKRPFSGS